MCVVSLLFHDVYVGSPGESGFQSKAADRYKLAIRDFDAQLEGIAGARQDAPVLVPELTGGLTASARSGRCATRQASAGRTVRVRGPSPAVRRSFTRRRKAFGYRDGRSHPYVYVANPFLLTVDDGGVSYYTLLADRLEAIGWRAHCFVSTDTIGRRGFLDGSQIRELDARGHVIGSHSVSHPSRFSACSVEMMRQEWSHSRQVLEDLLGHEVIAASVPGGYYSRRVAQTARDAGLQVLFTSEPATALRNEGGLLVIGRFTIRQGDAPDTARRLVLPSPWTRYAAWASWNAKGVVKPLLGPSYMRVAEWIFG